MNAVVKFNNYLVSNSNKYGYYEIESFIHPNLDEKETLICTRYWRKSFWFITPESKEDIEKLEAAIKNNFKGILKVGEFANAEWDSNIDCLSEEYPDTDKKGAWNSPQSMNKVYRRAEQLVLNVAKGEF